MTRNRLTPVLAAALACGLVAAVPTVASAAPASKPSLKVAPAKPGVTSSITVVFKGPKLKRGTYYGVDLSIAGVTGGVVCSSSVSTVTLRNGRGATSSLTLKPRKAQPRADQWCDGAGRLEVRRYGPGRRYSKVLATRTFPVGTGKTIPTSTDVPVKITLLGGSTLTASAPGRGDRSAQLTGALRGSVSGKPRPTTDIVVKDISGTLTPLSATLAKAVFPPDPLCPDAAPPGTFEAVPASSDLALPASGAATFNLTLNGAASQLFGCGPAGPLNGTTTLPLNGKAGPKGLLELSLAGAVTNIPLPAGSQGGLAANLVVNVDLSGQG